MATWTVSAKCPQLFLTPSFGHIWKLLGTMDTEGQHLGSCLFWDCWSAVKAVPLL
jgi:hypothetical protein